MLEEEGWEGKEGEGGEEYGGGRTPEWWEGDDGRRGEADGKGRETGG